MCFSINLGIINKYLMSFNIYLLINDKYYVTIYHNNLYEVKLMKKETIFLKIAVFLIGLPIFLLCIFLFPWITNAATSSTKMAYVLYGILIIMYASAIPFFIALYQAFKLLTYIDRNEAFSELSVKALQNIKNCAAIISILYILCLPLYYIVAEADDAPGIIVIGLIFIFGPMVVSVFAAVLQKLLQNAIDIKRDNDLTI